MAYQNKAFTTKLGFSGNATLNTLSVTGSTSFSTSATVTAAGTTQETATAITADYNVVTNVASGTGVTLPTATVGRRILIVNKGANTLNVYPATGAAIDSLTTNTAISLPANSSLEFNAASITLWYSSLNLYVPAAAGGITVVNDNTTNTTHYLTFTSATSGTITSESVSSTKLTFNPSTGALSATDFNSSSDRILKENIKTAKGLSVVMNLRGVEFNYISSGKHASGVIAQEIEMVLPHTVTNTETHKVVAYQQIIAHLIEGMKEQQTQIDELRALISKQ